jgi:hypothetical protein
MVSTTLFVAGSMSDTVPSPWFGIHSYPSGPRTPSVERFPEWLERVRTRLEGDPEEVLAAMRRLEAALRDALQDARQNTIA